ncbi:MAG: DUF4348 domain-containing protein [Bacteroidaceae bacterium]|nr:DUF4348 domain-containing protein [Bacteroidaceae bacterium]
MMKILCWVCIVAIACGACGRQKAEKPLPPAPLDIYVPDTSDRGDSDTLFFSSVEENFFSGEDGIFEEFLYEFSADTAMQMHRIHFPLPYLCKGEEIQLGKQEWDTSRLLGLTDIYYTLFERDAEMDAERDTAMRKANLECVDMKTRTVRTFFFEKLDGCWKLLRVNERELASYKHREFFSFYHRFVTDSVFQSLHVNDPMTFVTLDPEDDFNILEANIDMEQWFAFRPVLPEHLLVNVDYGVKPSRRPQRKILTCKSLGGNFNHTSYFRKIKDEWVLTRFEDMSN